MCASTQSCRHALLHTLRHPSHSPTYCWKAALCTEKGPWHSESVTMWCPKLPTPMSSHQLNTLFTVVQ